MSTVFVECWKCDECGHRWIKGEVYPDRCASSKCRKRSWDKDAKPKLTQQLEASIAVTPEVTDGSPYDGRDIPLWPPATPSIQELRDICAGKIAKIPVGELEAMKAATPELQLLDALMGCSYTEWVPELGETMACGLPQHSMKQKHGNWRKA